MSQALIMSRPHRTSRSTKHAGLALAAALLGTAAPLLAAGRGHAREATDPRATVRDSLNALREGGERSRAVERIAGLGVEETSFLLSILAGEETLDPEDQGPLITPETEALFLEVLASWPRERACEETLEWSDRHPDSATRLLALRALGSVGEREALPPFFEILASVPPEQQQHPRVAGEVERGLAAILLRDPRGHELLATRLRDMDPLALERLAPAVATVSDERGLSLLESLTGRSDDLDLVVLRSLEGWRTSRFDCRDRGAAALAASFLDSAHEPARRQAAATLGRLRDTASVAPLVDLLSDDSPGVARAAHWALLETVGGNLAADPAPWQDWLAREQEWFDAAIHELRAALAGEPGVAVQGLREVSWHPLWRDELATEVALAIRHSDPGVATAACGTLATLRADCAVAPLVDALSDGRPQVQAAAERALRGLTGEQLPKDARAWRQWLEH